MWVFKKPSNGIIKCKSQINKMKEFFLQAGMPMYTEEKQNIVNENEVNEAFEPANNLFDSLREAGDWLVDFISDIMNQLFGNLM